MARPAARTTRSTLSACRRTRRRASTAAATSPCSTPTPISLQRTKGGVAKFSNVSKDLLYVDYCTAWDAGADLVPGTDDDVCTNVDQVGLFSNTLLSYSWSYGNEGLKLAQFRFYEVPTATP